MLAAKSEADTEAAEAEAEEEETEAVDITTLLSAKAVAARPLSPEALAP